MVRSRGQGRPPKEFAGISGREAVAIAQAARDMAEDVAFTVKALAYYTPQVLAGTANSRIVEGFMERIQTLQRLAEARPERLARRGMRRSYERYLRRKGETAKTEEQYQLPFGEAD
jgi:hypothetical protein